MGETRSDAWLALAALPLVIWLEETLCFMLLNITIFHWALGNMATNVIHATYIGGLFFATMAVLTNTPFTRRLACVGFLAGYAWLAINP